MNYNRYTKEPEKSALFNGNSSSMGSNGVPDPTYLGHSQIGRQVMIPTGGGGGCVTHGPFSESVHHQREM